MLCNVALFSSPNLKGDMPPRGRDNDPPQYSTSPQFSDPGSAENFIINFTIQWTEDIQVGQILLTDLGPYWRRSSLRQSS